MDASLLIKIDVETGQASRADDVIKKFGNSSKETTDKILKMTAATIKAEAATAKFNTEAFRNQIALEKLAKATAEKAAAESAAAIATEKAKNASAWAAAELDKLRLSNERARLTIDKLKTATNEAGKATKNQNRNWSDFFANMLNAREGAAGLLGNVLRLGTGAYITMRSVETLARIILAVPKALYNASVEAEKTKITLDSLTGSVEAGTLAFYSLQNLAREKGVDIGVSSDVIAKLKGFGVENEKLVPLMERFTIATRGDTAAMSRLALVFGQVTQQGRTYGDDLRQIFNTGVPLAQALVKELGVAPSKLREMSKEGKITAEVLEQAIRRITDSGTDLANAMDRIANESAQGKWSRAFASLRIMMASLGKGVAEGTKPLATGLQGFADSITAMSELNRFIGGARDVDYNLIIKGLRASREEELTVINEFFKASGKPVVATVPKEMLAENKGKAFGAFEGYDYFNTLLDTVVTARAGTQLTAEQEENAKKILDQAFGKEDPSQDIYDKIVIEMQKKMHAEKQKAIAEGSVEGLSEALAEAYIAARDQAFAKAGAVASGKMVTDLGFFAEKIIESPTDITEVKDYRPQAALTSGDFPEIENAMMAIQRAKLLAKKSKLSYEEASKAIQELQQYNASVGVPDAATLAELTKAILKAYSVPDTQMKDTSYTKVAFEAVATTPFKGDIQKEMYGVSSEDVLNVANSLAEAEKAFGSASVEAEYFRDKLKETKEELEAIKYWTEQLGSVEAAKTFVSLTKSLKDLAFSATTTALTDMFKAIGSGSLSTETFEDNLKSLFDQMSQLFIMAGLQIIIGTGGTPPGIALGLTFMALGGLTALWSGAMDYSESKEDYKEVSGAPHYNAMGGVYSSPSLSSYSGGVYNTPQMFAFANGAGVFAERGYEGILPLTRTSTGKLGVTAVGGSSSNVTVQIIDQSSGNVAVSQTQTTNANGDKIIRATIRDIMRNELASGSMNSSLKAANSLASGRRRV